MVLSHYAALMHIYRNQKVSVYFLSLLFLHTVFITPMAIAFNILFGIMNFCYAQCYFILYFLGKSCILLLHIVASYI